MVSLKKPMLILAATEALYNPETYFSPGSTKSAQMRQNDGKVKKLGKRVKWADSDLETVKFFKLTDLPITPGLSPGQVEDIQKHTANVPSHMMYSELRKLDMKMDRHQFEEKKTIDSRLQLKLNEMKPQVRFHKTLLKCKFT